MGLSPSLVRARNHVSSRKSEKTRRKRKGANSLHLRTNPNPIRRPTPNNLMSLLVLERALILRVKVVLNRRRPNHIPINSSAPFSNLLASFFLDPLGVRAKEQLTFSKAPTKASKVSA